MGYAHQGSYFYFDGRYYFAYYKMSLRVRAAYSERACLECVSEEAIPSAEDLIMTLNLSKTLLVLSAGILLAVTYAALAAPRGTPVFPQRALTIKEFPNLFTVVSP